MGSVAVSATESQSSHRRIYSGRVGILCRKSCLAVNRHPWSERNALVSILKFSERILRHIGNYGPGREVVMIVVVRVVVQVIEVVVDN